MKTLLSCLGFACSLLSAAAVAGVAQQAYLKSDSTATYFQFGFAVAISGDTAVVGSVSEPGGGAAYVFARSSQTWTQQAKLRASNAELEDGFGGAVAISGDTIVVGASSEDSAATGVNGDQNNNNGIRAGAAYVFVRSGTTWTQQAYLKASNTEFLPGPFPYGDGFGAAVAISGDTVVVGAPDEASNATGVNGNQSNNSLYSPGAAYVFTRSGTTWSQQAYLKASNTASSDAFGRALAISGDTIIVGASGEDSRATGVNGDQANNDWPDAGAAYVFARSGTTWAQQAYLKASNTNSNAYFGTSVAISGETAAVGATVNSYVFIRSGTTWTQQALIPVGGKAIGLSGDKLIAGNPDDTSNASGLDGGGTSSVTGAGAAYLYTRNGTTWTQQTYIKGNNTEGGDIFGFSVAISGDTVIAGAPGENSAISGINSSQSRIYRFVPFAGAAYIIVPPPTAIRAIPATQNGLTGGGGTHTFPTFLVGDSVELTVGLHHYGTTDLVLTGTPAVAVTGGNGFTVIEQPGLTTIPTNGSTTFKVRFQPSISGVQTGTFSIPTNDPAQSPLTFQLVGRGLSFADDTDGDGLNDASEFRMTALNFNWELSQPALASAYLAEVNRTPLYTPAQLQALHPGKTLAAKDPVSGRFKVTTQWKKSTNLLEFVDFPAPPESSVSITPAGKIDFEFAAPADKSAYFRLGQD